jgi:hypothetical protein
LAVLALGLSAILFLGASALTIASGKPSEGTAQSASSLAELPGGFTCSSGRFSNSSGRLTDALAELTRRLTDAARGLTDTLP